MANPHKQFFTKISTFLADRKASDGGYAPVTSEEMASLHEILSELVDLKWERDPDGDSPVRFSLCDLTNFEPPIANFPVRRSDKPSPGISPMEMLLRSSQLYASMGLDANNRQQLKLRELQDLMEASSKGERPVELSGRKFRLATTLDEERLKAVVRQGCTEYCDRIVAARAGSLHDRMELHGSLANRLTELAGHLIVVRSLSALRAQVVMHFEVPCLEKTLKATFPVSELKSTPQTPST